MSETNASARLATDQATETGLVLHDAVRNAHLAAQGRQENDQLDRVNIVSDDDQLGLFLLNQRRDRIDALADHKRPLGRRVRFTSSADLGAGAQPLLLCLSALRPVFVQQLEQLGCCMKQ